MRFLGFLRSSFAVIFIFILALGVRLLYNVTVAKGYAPLFDAGNYQTIGLNLLYLHTYCPKTQLQTLGCLAGRAPLWPWIIAALAWIFGPATLYPRLFFCLIGSGTCLVLYFFARDLWGKRIAFITGSLAAIYVGLFLYDGWMYTESLFTFLQLCFCYFLFRFQRTKRYIWTIASGIVLVLASLTRPNGLDLLGLTLIWAALLLWSHRLSWRQAITAFVMIFALTITLIAPWTVRNYRATHQIILIAVGNGAVLAGAYNNTVLHANVMGDEKWIPTNSPMKQSVWINLQGRGLWMSASEIQPPLNVSPLKDSDAYRTSYALHWIKGHLSSMPYLFGLHFINTWIPYTSEEGLPMIQFPTRLSSQIVWDMVWYVTPIVYLLAAAGLVATWRRWKQDLIVVYLVVVFTVGINVVLYGSSRFRAPIEPFLILLTGGCIWWLSQHLPNTWRTSSQVHTPIEHRSEAHLISQSRQMKI